MNILQLCLSSGLGGLELYVYRASDALNKNHKVTAVLLKDSKLDDYYRQHSSIDILHLNRKKNPVPLLNARRLANIIDDNEIDIVHMHWGKDLALAAFAKFFSSRKPRLVYTRQMMITRYKNDLYHRFLYSQLDLMLTITRQLESLCKKFIDAKNLSIKTLYYGVNPPGRILDDAEIRAARKEKGFTEDDFVVGLFGRLEEEKGQHLLISAIAEAKTNKQDIKALLVGHEMNAGYRETLQQLAEEKGVLDNIKFNDFVDRPQELMQICDCICLATYEETFGLVLPEAMRSGITVIGSNSGGVPEIIEHDRTGLLFESKDAHSLYQQIARLYSEPALTSLLAANGKTDADKRFNTEDHFALLEKYITSI
jgi:glycosyltransferase involved in cell wall biosynthesis